MFDPSEQQSDFFAEVRNGTSNIALLAGAGCGKTTTLVEALKCLPVVDAESFLPPAVTFLAFNKSIAEALAPRVPRHVCCRTFHSLGFSALKAAGAVARNVKVDSRKVPSLVWRSLPKDDPDTQGVIKLVGLMKGTAPKATIDLQNLSSHFDIDFQNERTAFNVAQQIFQKSAADRDTIDFDDMLWMPVAFGCPFAQQDFVFVDEAQDTNDIQLEILERLAAPKATKELYVNPENGEEVLDEYESRSATRYFFVGDPYQSIYGFRGANSDSISRIIARFACKTMPLSVSYRCPQSVVAEARKALESPLFR